MDLRKVHAVAAPQATLGSSGSSTSSIESAGADSRSMPTPRLSADLHSPARPHDFLPRRPKLPAVGTMPFVKPGHPVRGSREKVG